MVDRAYPRIIPISNSVGAQAAIPAVLQGAHRETTDLRQRQLRDLRISVTDRCNFRCTYCMPKSIFDQNYSYLSQDALLRFEEITRMTQIFASLGVEKIRLTGGEPLLRKNLESLVAMLAEVRTPTGQKLDLTLTTNGSLLRKKAQLLKNAGLQRITISLDALSDTIFKAMNDVDFAVDDVLDGIEAAKEANFESIKVNMVVKKGVNEQEILPMARHFRNSGITLRLIEFMDVGSSNGWNMAEVMPSQNVIKLIDAQFPLQSLEPNYIGEVAQRWRYVDGGGEIGVISSVTQSFCHTCTRARLSTDGQLFLCLFAHQGVDFKSLLRAGKSDLEIANAIMNTWAKRDDHYSEIRGSQTPTENSPGHKVEMSYIGG